MERTADPQNWPLYWFARLERAVEQGDHQDAAKSQTELARLGVVVHYGRPLEGETEGDASGR
jgi:hypothetical protein